MTALSISKNTEAKVVATVWNMAGESLNPDDYVELERILSQLCDTRSIDRKTLGIEQAIISGKRNHDSDCSTNNAPALLPGPCDCFAV